MFVINKTEFQDFDILALGSFPLLEQLFHKREHSNLIKSSKFGGIPLVIMDTTDTMRGALSCIKEYKKLYTTLTEQPIQGIDLRHTKSRK